MSLVSSYKFYYVNVCDFVCVCVCVCVRERERERERERAVSYTHLTLPTMAGV